MCGVDESPDTIAWLQEIIDRSAATAGPAIRRGFSGDWAMSAREFVEFWTEGRMASISTVSVKGDVHVAPLDPAFRGGRFYVLTYNDSQRLKDHLANPRCAISSWDAPYRAVIVYGTVQITSDPALQLKGTVEEESMVTIEVTPTRIYAIRPPPGRHAGTPT